MADIIDTASQVVRIAMVGKYTGLADSYLSVTKALFHASVHCQAKLEIVWIESADLEEVRDCASCCAGAR